MTVARERLMARATVGGATVSPELADRLLTYLGLLSLWNRRINLTAFDLSNPTDEAIDRLLVEPVAAAPLVRSGDRRGLDIGSGGGSPAVPLMLSVPSMEMTLVEVRAKKAAFLREVVRTMGLPATVEVTRVEELSSSGAAGLFDVITFRAVRADAGLWRAVNCLLEPSGQVLWFGGLGHSIETSLIQTGLKGSTMVLERASR
jgi:16S rRNA (guanine527-N7)-methyltransferase